MEEAILKDVLSEILVSKGEASKKPSERESRRGFKNGPRKRREQQSFWGSVLAPFLSLGQLLALSWGTLLLSFCLLVPRASKREVQERPRAAKELPKGLEEFQERPRGSQESPGEFQNRPKTAPIFRKRESSARKKPPKCFCGHVANRLSSTPSTVLPGSGQDRGSIPYHRK